MLVENNVRWKIAKRDIDARVKQKPNSENKMQHKLFFQQMWVKSRQFLHSIRIFFTEPIQLIKNGERKSRSEILNMKDAYQITFWFITTVQFDPNSNAHVWNKKNFTLFFEFTSIWKKWNILYTSHTRGSMQSARFSVWKRRWYEIDG